MTSPLRTVVDLLIDAPLVTAVVAADAACHADPPLLDALRSDLANPGHREGVGRARHRLELVEPMTESPLESLVRLLLLLSDVPRPRAQVSLVTATGQRTRVDFLVGGANADGIVVEADGRRHHEPWDAAVADRRRQNLLVEDGFRVMRTTWDEVTRHPEEVVRVIRSGLAAKPASGRRPTA